MNKLFGKIFKSTHSGGYVLITAVSAVLLVSVASAAIISSSYVSLSRQIKSFDYMKSKYEAEGQIEALLGLFTHGFYSVASDSFYFDGKEYGGYGPESDEVNAAYVNVALSDDLNEYYGTGHWYLLYAYSVDRELRISADIIVEEHIDGETVLKYRDFSVESDFDEKDYY